MTIDKREELIELYDSYSLLLTDKQKSYFEEYYFDDLSFTEIAINHNVSRNAVFDQLKRVASILTDYENKLGLVKKSKKIMEMDIDLALKEKIIEIIKE